jgi:hypothetical protein
MISMIFLFKRASPSLYTCWSGLVGLARDLSHDYFRQKSSPQLAYPVTEITGLPRCERSR